MPWQSTSPWQPPRSLGRGTGLLPEPFTFWLLVLGVLVVARRRAWPVWSASWIGYALVFGLERTLSAGPNTWLTDLKFIAWLAAALAMIFWLARRDWLSGLLAVLPLAPMRVWWLGGEAASGFLSQALTFTSIGLMVCMAVTAMLRSGRWQTAVLLILAVELAAGIPVPYAGLAPPSPPAGLPNFGLENVGLLLLFTAPLWLLALWRQALRAAARLSAFHYQVFGRIRILPYSPAWRRAAFHSRNSAG